jgi:hypothetical protein
MSTRKCRPHSSRMEAPEQGGSRSRDTPLPMHQSAIPRSGMRYGPGRRRALEARYSDNDDVNDENRDDNAPTTTGSGAAGTGGGSPLPGQQARCQKDCEAAAAAAAAAERRDWDNVTDKQSNRQSSSVRTRDRTESLGTVATRVRGDSARRSAPQPGRCHAPLSSSPKPPFIPCSLASFSKAVFTLFYIFSLLWSLDESSLANALEIINTAGKKLKEKHTGAYLMGCLGVQILLKKLQALPRPTHFRPCGWPTPSWRPTMQILYLGY